MKRKHAHDEPCTSKKTRLSNIEAEIEDFFDADSPSKLYEILCEQDGRITAHGILERSKRVRECRPAYVERNAFRRLCDIGVYPTTSYLILLLTESYSSIQYTDIELEKISGTWIDCVLFHHRHCDLDLKSVFNPLVILSSMIEEEECAHIARDGRVFTIFLKALYCKVYDKIEVNLNIKHLDTYTRSYIIDTLADLSDNVAAEVCHILEWCTKSANTYHAENTTYIIVLIDEILHLLKDRCGVISFLKSCAQKMYTNEALGEMLSCHIEGITTTSHIRRTKMFSFTNRVFCDTDILTAQ